MIRHTDKDYYNFKTYLGSRYFVLFPCYKVVFSLMKEDIIYQITINWIIITEEASAPLKLDHLLIKLKLILILT